MAGRSIITGFLSVGQRAFIRTVPNRSRPIYLSGFALLETEHLRRKQEEYIDAGLLHETCKQNIGKPLRARIVKKKKCFNVRLWNLLCLFFRQ